MKPPALQGSEYHLPLTEPTINIPSVNFHLWEPCNMRCQFCFATFKEVKQTVLPKGHLPKYQALDIIRHLAEMGFEKVTFAGGEPTLCPWLLELIALAKDLGLTTMLVTNGTKLTKEFLKANQNKLDWITISIDSLNVSTNLKAGRAITGKQALGFEEYTAIVDNIKGYGYGFKMNTVISRLNFEENMVDFISYAKPSRWKILQVLPIKGENDAHIGKLKITEEEFQYFIDKHSMLKDITKLIPEANNQMKGSYVMVDPAGRFFDNTDGKIKYSQPILKVGGNNAFKEMPYDTEKFLERGGIYDWQLNKSVNL
jgi:radical S-adenosyl methionine domain-containing protein 2